MTRKLHRKDNKVNKWKYISLKGHLIRTRWVIFGDIQFMSKHTFHIKNISHTCSYVQWIGFYVSIETNYTIFNVQDFGYCLCTSSLDYFGQVVSPLWKGDNGVCLWSYFGHVRYYMKPVWLPPWLAWWVDGLGIADSNSLVYIYNSMLLMCFYKIGHRPWMSNYLRIACQISWGLDVKLPED